MQPFRDIVLSQSFVATHAKISQRIDSLSNDVIMANNLELLADNFYEEFYIQPVTIYDEDFSKRKGIQGKIRRRLDPFFSNAYNKEYVEVDGISMTFYFAYEGERDLFKCQASTFSMSGYPEINISDTHISFAYEKTLQEMEQEGAKESLLKTLDHDLKNIRAGIEYCNRDVISFNASLRANALARLQEKRKKVESYFSVASMFELPVSKTTYAETHIPLKRNISPISQVYDRQSVYCINDRDYKDILLTIKHTGSTYERTPSSYKSMHEEDLRNTLLASLNATYKGDATGEAFRNKGKTDICIEFDNRAAFVAECKMWTGQKDVTLALDQLVSYLTWRDCKTALIYFVRRNDFMRILSTAETALRAVSTIRQIEIVDKNEFKCCMISKSNPGQQIQVRVMLFNLSSE
jgi:hypothetical protein